MQNNQTTNDTELIEEIERLNDLVAVYKSEVATLKRIEAEREAFLGNLISVIN